MLLALVFPPQSNQGAGGAGWSIQAPIRLLPALQVLALVVVIQFAMGVISYRGDAAVLLLYLVASMVIYAVGQSHGERLVEAFAVLVALAAIASVLIALVQALDLDLQASWVLSQPSWYRPGANLGQANHLGTLMLWGWMAVLFLRLRKKIARASALFAISLLMIGLAISGSRTAMLGTAAVMIWAGFRYFNGPRWRRFSVAAAGVLAVYVLFWAWPQGLQMFFEGGAGGFSIHRSVVNTSGGARWLVWPQLIFAATERPLLGWGVGELVEAHNHVAHLFAQTDAFSYAHNVLIDLVIGVGFPMAVGLSVYCCYWAFVRVRAAKTDTAWFAIAILIPFVIHSLLEFPFSYAYFLFPATFLCGALDSNHGAEEPTDRPTHLAWGWMSAGLLVAVLGLMTVRDYILLEEDFRMARSQALRIGDIPQDYRVPSVWVLTQLAEMTLVTRMVPEPNMDAETVALFRRVALRYPWSALQNRYALALALNNSTQEAQRQLKVIRAMHGEMAYRTVKLQWVKWSEGRYPQLAWITEFNI